MVLLGSTMLMTSNVFAQESINITENDNIKIIEENIDPYEKVIEDLNKEYDLDLGYNKVDPQEISLEDYTNMAVSLAKEQRETLNYIAMREAQAELEVEQIDPNNMSRASSYTVTDTKYTDNWAMMTATYTCTPGNPNLVSNPKNVKGSETGRYFQETNRWYVQEDWSYKRLDAGRTLGITTTGYTCTLGGLGRIDNVKIYCEFEFIEK